MRIAWLKILPGSGPALELAASAARNCEPTARGEEMSRWRTGRQAVFAALFAAVIGVGSAYAFTVTPGNNPEPDEENLLLNTGQTGLVVQGTTNQSGAIVNLSSNEELVLPANGQARVEAVDGGFRILGITTVDATFGDLILNIKLNGEGNAAGSVMFQGFTVSGSSFSNSFALGNGENFFTLVAGANDPFLAVVVIESGENDIHDIRQIRISQVCLASDESCAPPRVAEPTMLTLLGASMLGLVGLARRRNGR